MTITTHKMYISPDGDTRITDGLPTTNFGDATEDEAGYDAGKGAEDIYRSLFYFVLPPPGNHTTNPATANSVLSRRFANKVGVYSSDTDLDHHRVNQDWVELQATWNVHSTGNNWNASGLDIAGTDADATPWFSWTWTSAQGSDEWINEQTAALQTELNYAVETEANQRFDVHTRTDTEGGDIRLTFRTREFSGDMSEAFKRPKLELEYSADDSAAPYNTNPIGTTTKTLTGVANVVSAVVTHVRAGVALGSANAGVY